MGGSWGHYVHLLDRPSVVKQREERAQQEQSEQAPATHKAQGTAAYKSGDFLQAAQYFAQAITKKEDRAAPLFSNLSAALLRANQADEALRAADECVEAEPGWVKGKVQPLGATRSEGTWSVALATTYTTCTTRALRRPSYHHV